jgi:hypothetical protein
MTTESLRVGVAQIDITPESPTPLAGFAIRNNAVFEGIDHPLFLKAFWWSVGDEHALLVVADILWWAPERVDDLRACIAHQWPVSEERIILHATHTHSAPHPSRVFTESLGIWDDSWIDILERRLHDAIRQAWEARIPARVRRGRGTSGIGINRRVALGVEPEASGKVDPEVIVLRIDDDDSNPIAVLVHYSCHPTINELPRVSAEFPGVMCERIQAGLGDNTIVAFLQGACGDINPLPFLDRGKRPIGDADVIEMGEILAGDVQRVLDAPMDQLNIDSISTTRTIALLEMQRVPSPDELAAAKDELGVIGEWARVLLANPGRCTKQLGVEITHLRLGDHLSFLAMAAEVTTPCGLMIKTHTDSTTLPLPYSNGMVGYVITDDQLAQGGYEAIESAIYFGLPSPFAPGIEETFSNAITRALRT